MKHAMHRFFVPACAAVVATARLPSGSSDFFPIHPGAWWTFSYVKAGGGLGVTGRDEGTIRWAVVSMIPCGGCSGPQYVVEQRRFITRSTFNEPQSMGGRAEDTAYDPPRLLSVNSLHLYSWSHGNALLTRIGGWQYPKTQCAFFFHDAAQVGPSDSLKVVRTQVAVLGGTIDAIKVIPLVCPFGCAAGRQGDSLRYFTLADGIGPVAYRERNTPCFLDGYYTETWTLTSYSGATGYVRRPVIAKGSATGNLARTYALNGALLEPRAGNRLDVRSQMHDGTRAPHIVVTVNRQGIAKLEHVSKGE